MTRDLTRAAVAALLLSACAMNDGLLQPAGAVEPGATWLRTDRAEYVAAIEAGWRTVDFDLTYRNHLSVAVAVPSCHNPVRPALEKFVDGAWVHAYSAVELLCITPPLLIAAGETYRFRYLMRVDEWSLRAWPGAAGGDISGTYRLVWFVATAPNRGPTEPLPLERRVSNEFRIVM